jgi:serine phosphatase RsbU (regulator of sigma subunit)
VPSVLSTYFPDNVKSCFFAPIEFKNEVIGLIQFFSVEKILIINERENFFLASFINQIASAINNSAVYEKLSKALSDLERVHKKLKEKTDTLTEDMKLARKVQQGILPTDFTNITELEIFLRYFPLQQVGGDLYDITKLDNNIVRVFICDATGHGVQAALTTMAIKTLYEKGKRTCKTPGELLNYLSKEYSLIPDTGNLFTAFVADINTEDLILHYANAGHPYPVLVTKEGCKHVSGREMMMGLDYSRADYKTHSIKISASDKLFIFTDGLYEEFNSQMDEYGEKNIADFLLKNKELPLEELGKGLIKDVQTFMDRKSLNDDLCLLGIKIK